MPTIYTLTGNSEAITYKKLSNCYEVSWGNTNFEFTFQQRERLMTEFFKEPNVYYPLGADMTNPTPRGMGEFLKTRFKVFSPRYASAIAAILVDDGNQLIPKLFDNSIFLRKSH